MPSCVEHAGFYGIHRDTEDRRHRIDWLFVVIGEIEDFPVVVREFR